MSLGTLAYRFLFIPALFAVPSLAGAADIGPYSTFKDWIVGCSNLRACTALGLPAGEDSVGGYLKVSRGAAADAAPKITFNIIVDNPPANPTLRVKVEGAPGGAAAVQSLPASGGDSAYVSASISGDAALALIRALPEAQNVHLSLESGGKTVADTTISLAGSAAAILFFDDRQGRVGTVGALGKKGDIADSAVPALPAEPVVHALPITALDPVPAAPPGLPKVNPDKDNCNPETGTPVAFRLSGDLLLWGSCSSTGAYNFSYRFYLAGKGAPKPLTFPVPGDKPDPEMDGVLVNPVVAESGKAINATNLGRGVGDCGDSQDWAWNGQAFELVRYAEMKDCRGVIADDWPVLYSSRLQ